MAVVVVVVVMPRFTCYAVFQSPHRHLVLRCSLSLLIPQ